MDDLATLDFETAMSLDIEAVRHREQQLDEALEDSFPASDPISAHRFD